MFVLTHHAHDPIQMEGSTTFYFVTEGFDAALQRARGVAGEDGEIAIGGVDDPGLEPAEVVASPHATHIRYRVGR